MYDLLKAIAAAQTPTAWSFTYARTDYQNLHDEAETVGLPHIFLDPVQIDESHGEYGQVESRTYSGKFLVLVSSDVDTEDYDTKYQTYIKPIIDTTLGTIKTALQCQEVDIDVWRTVEVINVFDYNFDGVVVTYTIKEDV